MRVNDRDRFTRITHDPDHLLRIMQRERTIA